MHRTGNRVVVEAQSEVQGKTRPNRPLISAKPRKLVLVDGKSCRCAEFDPLKCFPCHTDNVHVEELLVAIVRAMGEIEASLQLVVTIKMLRTGLIDLLPLRAIRVAILPIEESTVRGLH